MDIHNYNNFKENKLSSNNIEKNLPLEKIIEGLIYNLPGLPRTNYIMKINKNNFIINDESYKDIIFDNLAVNKKLRPIINYILLMKFLK